MIVLSILFFLSGAAGLVYEVVWTRALADVLGSTAWSMAAVFSVFLAGLALGADFIGRRATPGIAALRTYARLEFAIGTVALVSSMVMWWGSSWLAAHGPGSASPWGLLYAVAVSGALVGPPAFLMGGTLPVLLSASTRWTDARGAVPVLYGFNTLGAAFGALAAGFVLIWLLGLRGTVLLAAAVNVGVGMVAWWMAGRVPEERDVPAPPADIEEDLAADAMIPTGLWMILAFVSGAGVLAYEILWGRISRFILGDRTLAIAALLFVFVSALGVGSLLAPVLLRRLRVRSLSTAFVLACVALLAGSLVQLLMVPMGVSAAAGRGLMALAHDAGTVGRLLVMGVLILPGATILGLVFPMLAWSLQELEKRPGPALGRLYLVNTAGAVVGALSAGLLLAGWMGTPRGFLFVAGLSCAVATGILLRVPQGARWRRVGWGSMVLVLLAASVFPRDLVFLREDETLVMSNEDAYGVQVLTRVEATGHMRVRNNRIGLIFDLGHPDTRYAQGMAAHLTALLAGSTEEVLNVGTGYGITAGTYTLYPTVSRIETVEILPFLVRAQDRFAAHNFGYATDSRVTTLVGDGRHMLAAGEAMYDVLSVNVLDPYLPGSASLYTVEFWELARSRLNPGGVFNQLFWGEDVSLLLRGLHSVFPTVLYFEAYGGSSYNVVAFRDEVKPDEVVVHFDRMGPDARRDLTALLGSSPEDALPGLVARGWEVSRILRTRALESHGPLHTDDRPILEYRWAHGVSGVSIFDSPLVVN